MRQPFCRSPAAHDPGVAELTRVWVGAGRRHSQQWNLQLRAATVTNDGHILVSPSAGWLSFVLHANPWISYPPR
jgi:hypothetical protein